MSFFCIVSVSSISSTFFFFYCSADLRHLHSFPTRRSSDLIREATVGSIWLEDAVTRAATVHFRIKFARSHETKRSEEHTSEFQSRQYLVCRLLLEKKKKKRKKKTYKEIDVQNTLI